MKITRRKFVMTGVTGMAGFYAGACQSSHAEFSANGSPPDEDGYRLWLRYTPSGARTREYRGHVRQIHVAGGSATADVIRNELRDATTGLLGQSLPVDADSLMDGAVVVGTPENSPPVRELSWAADLADVGPEGYLLRSTRIDGKPVTVIAANSDIGALYGTFHFLRLLQTDTPVDSLHIAEKPMLQLRMLNHWDNLNGTVTRGYAGGSLWQWEDLPEKNCPRHVDYARACASIGINGAAINNVNADPRILSAEWLRKVAALADAWRPYGVRMYLSVNFAAPIHLDGLPTADPLDPQVIDWWKRKADEIYGMIPDFGGLLVKADSEGEPGPKQYKRTHADGANLLADALAPHDGVVIWRAFVYDPYVDPDRAKRAYIEFTRLDGKFRPNVAVQVKNGPLDFMPREPFHPLFAALKHTPVIAEIQPTQEYLGQANHLVYHQADEEGIGYDRTRRGSGAVDQYHPPLCDEFDDIARCPEKFLLWFHRCPWDHRMKSGRTLWDELCGKYHDGAEQAAALQKTWQSLAGKIDAQRHREVAERLAIQVEHAAQWRDAILEYFARFSKRPIPR